MVWGDRCCKGTGIWVVVVLKVDSGGSERVGLWKEL